jgi:hypothetical protein
MPVYPDPVKLCITVEEGPKLKKRIRTVLDTGDHAARRECSLFNISVEVLGIAVQDQLPKLLQLGSYSY